jgi:hypothetical protein
MFLDVSFYLVFTQRLEVANNSSAVDSTLQRMADPVVIHILPADQPGNGYLMGFCCCGSGQRGGAAAGGWPQVMFCCLHQPIHLQQVSPLAIGISSDAKAHTSSLRAQISL